MGNDWEEFAKKREALRSQILASPAHALRAETRALATMLRAYVKNHWELGQLLKRFRDDVPFALSLMSQGSPDLEPFLDEVDRLLHNEISAARRLRDHAGLLIRKRGYFPEGDPVRDQYDASVKADFGDDPEAKFIVDLHRHLEHHRLPRVEAVEDFDRDREGSEMDHYVSLPVDRLLSWGGWTAPAREYLSGVGEEIRLDAVLDRYCNKVQNFYKWLGVLIAESRSAQFEELDRLEAQLVALESGESEPKAPDLSGY